MKHFKTLPQISLAFCDMFMESTHASEDYSTSSELMITERTTTKQSSIQVELGRLLGSGGFGRVYEGVWQGKKIAVKQLTSKAKLKNANAPRESLQAERLVLDYRHRNIVKTLAVLSSELLENCMVVMEFAGEMNLQALIDDERVVFSETRRLQIAFDIASGLAYLHEQGLAHLDIKPANVIMSADNDYKICDFGCCQFVEVEDDSELQPPSPTKTALTGTFAYRAPELLKGDFPTTKADIYSLGVCLWQIMVREQPYGLESHFVIIFGVVQNNLRPRFPAEVLQSADHGKYVDLTTSLWHADPSKRPAASQIVRTLKHWTTS